MTSQIKNTSSLSRNRRAKQPQHARPTEQRRILAKVEQLMALVDEWEMQLTASLVTAANFLSALVTELTKSIGAKTR